jgi:cob(I)alamin adenosyltransferase
MSGLTKIYTRAGDGGITRLADGREVAKDSTRIAALGAVDELNAQIGLALSLGLCETLAAYLEEVQHRLLDLGAELAGALGREDGPRRQRLRADHVRLLEVMIDEFNGALGPLRDFILPGGSPAAAALQLARTVCRRAERQVVALSRQEELGEHVIPFLNRLSDALFVMARFENHQQRTAEKLWRRGG